MAKADEDESGFETWWFLEKQAKATLSIHLSIHLKWMMRFKKKYIELLT
jgi:hypothetical protein